MGICKCKRKTDLFCFVHKKAVCEDCICTDHSTCFVKTYVDWLTDSEYETPSCGICKGDLVEGNVVRLMCLDLFHPECLDVHAASLPPHTAKAGYLCPTCSKPVFPPDANSNLAKQLTQHLSNASWAKTIMSGKNPEPVVPSFDLAKKRKQADEASSIGAQDKLASDPSPASLTEIPLNNTSNPGTPTSSNAYASTTTVSLTPVGSSSTQSPNLGRSNSGLNDSTYGIASRKANKEQSIYIDEQDDDDKYKKRSVRELFTAMGFVNKPEKEMKPTKTRQTRIKLDTKRLLIVFALLSCLATVIVMGISLSNDPAAQEVVEQ